MSSGARRPSRPGADTKELRLRPIPIDPRTGRATLVVLIVLWAVVVGASMKMLLDYQVRPGAPAHAPASWPAASGIPRPAAHASLLLLAHPRCPCTRATIGELARIMADARGGLDARVLFVVPPGFDERWARADLWNEAARIPGVVLVLDRGGIEARHFGVVTSGQALLYDVQGRLRFAGGITPGRGHEGDNAGRDAILAIVASRPSAHETTPVYGCPLAVAAPVEDGTVAGCRR